MSEYAEYLQSAEWQAVRAAYFAKHPRRCSRCGSTADLQLHHKTYRHVFKEQRHLEDLTCLCAGCHAFEHGLGAPPPVKPPKVTKRQKARAAKKAQRRARVLARKRQGVSRYDPTAHPYTTHLDY